MFHSSSTFPYTVIFLQRRATKCCHLQYLQSSRHPNIIQRTAHKRILFNHLYRIRQDHLFNVGAEGKSGICYLCCSLFYFDRFCRILLGTVINFFPFFVYNTPLYDLYHLLPDATLNFFRFCRNDCIPLQYPSFSHPPS